MLFKKLLVNKFHYVLENEARRAIANNGLKINDKLVGDVKRTLKLDDFEEKILKISYGKKKHFKVIII